MIYDEDLNVTSEILRVRDNMHKLRGEVGTMKGKIEVMESKGENKWALWLAGIVSTLIITAITMISSNVIANDKDGRQRDVNIDNRITAVCNEQTKVNQEILIKLASISTDMQYVKKMVTVKK